MDIADAVNVNVNKNTTLNDIFLNLLSFFKNKMQK